MYDASMPLYPIEHHPPLAGRDAASVAAAVASALGELHGRGLVHGALRPDLVLLDEAGTVSLLPADEAVPGDASPADDVAALGGLLAWLAERAPDRPARKPPRLLRPRDPVDVLVDLAHRCRSVDPAARPSPGHVADTLHRRLTAPGASAPGPGSRGLPSVGRRRAALGSVVALGLVGAVAAPAQCAPSSAVDPEPRAGNPRVHWADGVLVVDARRYAVGEVGDHVLVDRWGCGPSSVALLRRSSGEVVAFDRFPDHGDHSIGRVVARFPGSTRLVARRAPDGCPALAVATADGRTVTVPWRAAS
jgi:hypothetical protein